jgi:hypothetical protein
MYILDAVIPRPAAAARLLTGFELERTGKLVVVHPFGVLAQKFQNSVTDCHSFHL